MNTGHFRQQASRLIDWVVDYYATLRDRPIQPTTNPGDVYTRLPAAAPRDGEKFEQIFADFEKLIVPHMTHWQHPRFFGYFPANISDASVFGEWLTAAMGAQCMSWATSPAATELELRVCEWVRDLLGLPTEFTGVIQDAASFGTMTALLCARERASDGRTNTEGLSAAPKYTVYCSEEAHSSIEKSARVIGLGSHQVRKIAVDERGQMQLADLQTQLEADIASGARPIAIVSAFGSTGQLAVDPLSEIQKICDRHRIWHHIDAAYLGAILLLDEYAHLGAGFGAADSIVFNPHKWLFTNFDCSLYFFRDRQHLTNCLSICPEYLRTHSENQMPDLRDWSLGLGRRFRALKLWFVLRQFGQIGLQTALRRHLQLTQELYAHLKTIVEIELLDQPRYNLIMFRVKPASGEGLASVNQRTMALMHAINRNDGRIFISHSSFREQIYLRIVCGQTDLQADDLRVAVDAIDTALKNQKP